MGGNMFQGEYIEHLLKKNSELADKLAQMKENYENALIKKDYSKDFLASLVSEILNATTTLAEDVDLFFEKITDALGVCKNILLRKSEILQLGEKMFKIMNLPHNCSSDFVSRNESSAIKEQNLETKDGKKGGTLKVSPMINGHVILTEPKIYLSKISEELTPTERNVAHSLSPIMEESPNSSLNSLESINTKEAIVLLERLNLRKSTSFIMYKDSPKSRFKKPESWKNSLGNKQVTDTSALSKGTDSNKEAQTGVDNSKSKTDPLEGPSWLYNENVQSNSPSQYSFDKNVTFKRRRRRFSSLFSQSEDSYHSDKSEDTKNEKNETMKNAAKKSPGECKKIIKRQSKNPVDIISESSESDRRNTVSDPLLLVNDRIAVEYSDRNESLDESEDTQNENKSPCYSNLKLLENDGKPDFFYDADNEEHSPKNPGNKSLKKRSSKSVFGSSPVKQRLSNSNYSPECVEQKESGKKRDKGSGRKNNETKETKKKKVDNIENDVKENADDPSKKLNLVKNAKVSCERTISESSSPDMFSMGSEGRKKRRAAPNNLTELSLKAKLRRD